MISIFCLLLASLRIFSSIVLTLSLFSLYFCPLHLPSYLLPISSPYSPLPSSFSLPPLHFHSPHSAFPHSRSSSMIRRFDNTSNFVAIIQFTCLWYKNGEEMRVMVQIQRTVFHIHTIICYASPKYQYIFPFHTSNPNQNTMNQQKRQ